MVNCKYLDCNKRATHGIYKSIPEYCGQHKLENMINVLSKRCKSEGCKIRAGFGYQDKQPEYCFSHKLENMVDLISKNVNHLTVVN